MSDRHPRDAAVSVLARLANVARGRGMAPQALLGHFGRERLLYRLGRSPAAVRFVLKGAMLHALWGMDGHRATLDMDLLVRGAISPEGMATTFREICSLPGGGDGVAFDGESIRSEGIRAMAEYRGVRVKLVGRMGRTRMPLRVDVTVGDAVVPRPRVEEFPSLLDMPRPRVAVYPREAVVAEKLHAMVTLGYANTRMKDYFDLWVLSRRSSFDGVILGRAVNATFERRRTPLQGVPWDAIEGALRLDSHRRRLWRSFLARTGASAEVPQEVVWKELAAFLIPMLGGSGAHRVVSWPPGGPWRST